MKRTIEIMRTVKGNKANAPTQAPPVSAQPAAPAPAPVTHMPTDMSLGGNTTAGAQQAGDEDQQEKLGVMHY